MSNKVLIVGAGGQLGQELQRTAPANIQWVAIARSDLDIANEQSVVDVFEAHKPDLVINAAAYTAVDKAESEHAAAELGNVAGPRILAQACATFEARLIHISTDFVFDGCSSVPYTPEMPTGPLGVYGQTKLDGELAVREALPSALILRTGWVYSAFGGNFVKTMLRVMGSNDTLTVVADQVGTPTWANSLALAAWAAAAQDSLSGTYHWSDAGVCSWYDFAVAIYEEATGMGLLDNAVTVKPIPAEQYPTPAQRPSYSVLSKEKTWADFQLEGVHWRAQLRAMLNDYKGLQNG
ncbi:MAG: dTDP-4-dehydrorhamnose reductase [Halioglobus sp.]